MRGRRQERARRAAAPHRDHDAAEMHGAGNHKEKCGGSNGEAHPNNGNDLP